MNLYDKRSVDQNINELKMKIPMFEKKNGVNREKQEQVHKWVHTVEHLLKVGK